MSEQVNYESWPWPAAKVAPGNYINNPPPRHCPLVEPHENSCHDGADSPLRRRHGCRCPEKEGKIHRPGRFMSPSRVEDIHLSSRDGAPRLHGSLHPAALGIPRSHCIQLEKCNHGPGGGGRARQLLALAPQERQSTEETRSLSWCGMRPGLCLAQGHGRPCQAESPRFYSTSKITITQV